MGYRPDITYRLEFHCPWPYWMDDFMNEDEFIKLLNDFAQEVAKKYPVIATFNHKDNMSDFEDLHTLHHERGDIAFMALEVECEIWAAGQKTYIDELNRASEKLKMLQSGHL